MSSKSISTKVAIVGAGVSGLKAAQTLLHTRNSPFGPGDITIIEAQDHVGGRIKTDRLSSKLGTNYDLGAAWFHDCLNNSVLDYVRSLSDFDIGRDTYFDDRDISTYDSTGKIDVSGLKLNRVVEDIEKFIELYYHDELDKKDMSLEEIVDEYFKKFDDFLTDEQKKYCGRIVRYYELWYGISWDIISGKYSIMDHQGRNLLNKRGYSYVIEKLHSEITPACSILLNQPIRKIIRNNKQGDKRLCLETTNGLSIYSDYAIITVPQSILQLSDPTHPNSIIWQPQLPTPIQTSLKTIHFGALGKVIFEFDEIWWNPTQDRFEILADPIPKSTTTTNNLSQRLTECPKPFTYPAYIINYASVKQTPALVILTQAPLTQYLESNPDEAWTYYGAMLSQLATGGNKITEPINTIVTDWTKNPYIRGSYAALHTHDQPSDLIIQLCGEYDGCGMASVGEEWVRFAGEHTVMEGAGCVHGAWNSGKREGEWILKDVENKEK
ncbi:CBP1 [[Candida] subhashii]|uniref:CBP1 n=1 Tax=[Candida] subhashii TaxID=561895 RepID=A0A8J5QJ65_9ASCO|nr:CBP1 [[Candida] subhashii]KAG7663073.1 CBP1 [[Candida] subhashii]